jgi:hypothetical protein
VLANTVVLKDLVFCRESYYWALLRRMPLLTALYIIILRLINKREGTRHAIE